MAPDAQDLAIQIAVMNTNLENLTKALSNGAFKNVTDTIEKGNAQVVKSFENYIDHQKEMARLERNRQDEMCKKIDKVFLSNTVMASVFTLLTLGLIFKALGVFQ